MGQYRSMPAGVGSPAPSESTVLPKAATVQSQRENDRVASKCMGQSDNCGGGVDSVRTAERKLATCRVAVSRRTCKC